jgi:hypothetical protein
MLSFGSENDGVKNYLYYTFKVGTHEWPDLIFKRKDTHHHCGNLILKIILIVKLLIA